MTYLLCITLSLPDDIVIVIVVRPCVFSFPLISFFKFVWLNRFLSRLSLGSTQMRRNGAIIQKLFSALCRKCNADYRRKGHLRPKPHQLLAAAAALVELLNPIMESDGFFHFPRVCNLSVAFVESTYYRHRLWWNF